MKKLIALASILWLAMSPVMMAFAQTADETTEVDCETWKEEMKEEMKNYKQQMKDNWSEFKEMYGELNQFFDEEMTNDPVVQRRNFREAVRRGTTSMTDEDRRGYFRNNWNPIRIDEYTEEMETRIKNRFNTLEEYVAPALLSEYDAWVDAFFDVFYANAELYEMMADMRAEYSEECHSENRRNYRNTFTMRLDNSLKKMDSDKLEMLLPRIIERLEMMIENTENSDMTDELKAIKLDMLYALLDLIQTELDNIDLADASEELTDEDYDTEEDDDMDEADDSDSDEDDYMDENDDSDDDEEDDMDDDDTEDDTDETNS